MPIRVLYHDHCFDGAASAAFFTRFAAEKFYPGAEFLYTGMMHTPAQTWDEQVFDGDHNAIVDFKYSPSPKLTWWFDHHQSAFLNLQDAEHFHAVKAPNHFFDPSYRSCTKFIAHIAESKFGFTAPDLQQLVHWADIVDGAQYPSAKEAVELSSAATQLVLVIEGAKGSDLVQTIIRLMQHKPLAEIIADPEVQVCYQPLYRKHLESIEMIRGASRPEGRVVFFDLVSEKVEGYNKFIPYYLFPDSVYTVSVLDAGFRTKISVGSNPWTPEPPSHNLATICERYGGGGHPRVGAISFPPGDVDHARGVAQDIINELNC
ncbi:MAG: phosphoesterase [Acidimicrobiia bacterium]|nr:phosphoesterase [Acidimicrobiia bacterium]